MGQIVARPERRAFIFITYYFDEGPEIGAVRTRAIARYLPDHGWLPVVVTSGSPADDAGPDLVVRHVPASSAIGSAKARLGIQVTTEAPAHSAARTDRVKRPIARRLRGVATEIGGLIPDFDRLGVASAILCKSPSQDPFSARHPVVLAISHGEFAAWSTSRASRLPWVAELRDLWAQRPYRSGTRLRRIPDLFLEKVVFRRVTSLVTVSEPLAERLRELHPKLRVTAIPSGIDPTLVPPSTGALDPDFSILYAGRIYRGSQDLGEFLKPLRIALDRGLVDPSVVRVSLLLLHPLADEGARLVDELGLADLVRVELSLPRAEVIERERRAQMLLHLRWEDPNEPGILTGKLFEYLASGRPILSTGRYRDGVVDLLDETRAGIGTITHEDTVAYLASAFAAFRATGRVPNEPDMSRLAQLDVRVTARAIAAELDHAVSSARN